MSFVKNENYILIQGWMVKELGLKGNELLVYAIIYGFSQVEGQEFSGSRQYLADWTNSTVQGVMKNLKSLVEKGLIEKKDKWINNVKFCSYSATLVSFEGGEEKLGGGNSVPGGVGNSVAGGRQLSCPNNIDINYINNIDKERKKERKANGTSYDKIINQLVNDEELKNTLYEFIKMRKLIKRPLTDRALEMMIKKLTSMESDVKKQIEILNQSITNCWLGIFPLKDQPTLKSEPKKEELWFYDVKSYTGLEEDDANT